MVEPAVPFSLEGEWSPSKARAIVEKYSEQAKSVGLKIEIIDVSTFSKQRVLIRLKCIKHDCVVEEDSLCARCVAGG